MIIIEHERRIHRENFNKELENIKKYQTKLKKTIIKIKYTLDRINSRLDGREEWISEPGRQGNRNHPTRTAKRRKEFFKRG